MSLNYMYLIIHPLGTSKMSLTIYQLGHHGDNDMSTGIMRHINLKCRATICLVNGGQLCPRETLKCPWRMGTFPQVMPDLWDCIDPAGILGPFSAGIHHTWH